MKILVNDFAGHPFQIQLSRALAKVGHLVTHTYFAGNNTPKGDTSAATAALTIKAIDIGRTFQKHSLLSRRGADVAYGRALVQEIRVFQPDLVLSANTPLDAQRLILRATHEVGGRFVFWLQDLLSVGIEFVLRKKHVPFAGIAGSYYRRMEKRMLHESDGVVCIAPEFCGTLKQWGLPAAKTFVIENWAPLDEVTPQPRQNSWAREHGIENKFCFMYSGTLGMKHKPELLLELARQFSTHTEVAMVVVAEGAGADWLKARQHTLQGNTLQVLPFQPYPRLSEVLASSDVLITLLDADCGAFAVPSKALAYMCAGRSLLVAAPPDNQVSRLVQRAHAGIRVATDVEPFLEAAWKLYADSRQREIFGNCARSYAERTFAIDHIVRRFDDVFRFAMNQATSEHPVRQPSTVAAS